jgi:serine/threonine protein kinase
MEYANCGSLERALKEAASKSRPSFWNPTGICIIICGIVLGMRYIHSRDMIHHNLKPSNILLKDPGLSLIGDFGIARYASRDFTRTGIRGTVQYTAPEMFDSSDTTTKVDVFSFGSIVYEIFVGSPAFDAALPPFEIVDKLKKHEMPDIPTAVSPFIKALILQCWEFNPSLRPSFTDIMRTFDGIDFNIVSGADLSTVRQYVREITDWESESQRPRT